MKYNIILIIALLLFSFAGYNQATNSSTFEITVTFTNDIPVKQLQVFYYTKGGNRFDTIHFKTDSVNNKIIIYGYNSYVLWVSFPSLVFTLSANKRMDETKEVMQTQYVFYLATTGSLSSYNQPLSGELLFSKKFSNIIVSQEKRSDVPLVAQEETVFGICCELKEAISISNEIVKINQQNSK